MLNNADLRYYSLVWRSATNRTCKAAIPPDQLPGDRRKIAEAVLHRERGDRVYGMHRECHPADADERPQVPAVGTPSHARVFRN
jgi:hypothetical protein